LAEELEKGLAEGEKKLKKEKQEIIPNCNNKLNTRRTFMQ
jgi:hypothetical protein